VKGESKLIKSLHVVNMNGNENFELFFHKDINILTGRNGAGKTTILKLLWYLISGNIERALEEIEFEYAKIEADTFSLELINTDEPELITINYTVNRESKSVKTYKNIRRIHQRLHYSNEHFRNEYNNFIDINVINKAIAEASGSSIFFPTFRRIEGGFSISNKLAGIPQPRYYYDVEEVLNSVSNRLSVNNHRFIASVSTVDIANLLNEKLAEISEQTNRLHSQFATSTTDKINQYTKFKNNQSDKTQLESANEILDSIQRQLTQISEQIEEIMRPFTVLSELIQNIFQHKGIRVSNVITIGDTKEAIMSDKLSAGEKQMLSFLCYNAFYNNCPIFIDEPEISLHVDWQRTLFPTLLKQTNNNQFFVATHSPFIYSKFEDKEIVLHQDRGGF